MTATEYINAGYKMSNHIAAAEITRAESEVTAAYITPIVPTIPTPMPQVVKNAIMSLTYLLLSQRNVFVTRSGQKEKDTATSRTPNAEDVLAQMSATCYQHIKILRSSQYAVNATADVTDICHIYFKTNYFTI